MSDAAPAALALAAAATLNTGFALALGALAAVTWLRRGRSAWALQALGQLQRAIGWALVTNLLASVGVLWLQAAAMAETPLTQTLPAIGTVLSQTHYGRAWMGGIAGLSAALAAAWRRSSALTGGRCVCIGAGLVAFAVSRSLVSHAAAQGDLAWAVAADVAHLLLVSLWAGLVFTGAFVLPAADGSAERPDRARWVAALSFTATLALAGVVLTGAFGAWRGLGSPAHLFDTLYGRILLIKLTFVCAAAALGGVNRWLVMPGLLEALRTANLPVEPALRRFASVLRIESAMLFAVIVAAAMLGATEPAASRPTAVNSRP